MNDFWSKNLLIRITLMDFYRIGICPWIVFVCCRYDSLPSHSALSSYLITFSTFADHHNITVSLRDKAAGISPLPNNSRFLSLCGTVTRTPALPVSAAPWGHHQALHNHLLYPNLHNHQQDLLRLVHLLLPLLQQRHLWVSIHFIGSLFTFGRLWCNYCFQPILSYHYH